MKISVITICYNSAAQIGRAIESVLAQSHPELEYVIVDGGSSDGTVDIVRSYASRDPRIRWVSEPDDGISDAMNKGVALATGEIVAHLHSDEYYLDPGVLAEVASIFEANPERVWLTGGFHFVDPSGRFLREIKVRRYSYRRLIHSNIILHPATFVKRSAFLQVGGFDLSLRYCMDYHLWLRLGALGDPVTVNHPLACFCVHGGSRSTMEAASAYAEEFQVRLEFLEKRGSWQFPYRLEYLVKKELNRIFIRRLIALAGTEDAC
ncbi:glycosyltransferase [Geomonas subterranea]|uniref:Glycosyltransferase n=1 Tax=Geomonas subterranea TaxID=2847989 RepID=A0ABX8LKU6_9BACT|nr:glycosyltransferase family 2 protein [Geomonas subterranea]QXE92338.1 glycosyltransferase [Geomonas subterranea]QXM09563.1 glycosyltransferase [Geomonas subterranea]